MRNVKIVAWCCLLWVIIAWCWAANNSPWDGTEWDSGSPDIDQPLGNAYKELYSIRRGVETRINYEHLDFATNSVGGVHSQGAAVAYHQDAIPLLDGDGEEFTTAANAGHLFIDTNHAFADKMFFLNTADGAGTNVWTGTYMAMEAELVADTHSWADVQTDEVEAIFTLGLTANDDITLGAGDDLVGSATSVINMNAFDVTAAGAMTTVTSNIGSTIAITGTLDEDAMGSDSAVSLATQQSIKKYVDDTVVTSDAGIKAWVTFDAAGNVLDHFNVTGVNRVSSGNFTITWATDFATVNYACVVTGDGTPMASIDSRTAGTVLVDFRNSSGTNANPAIGNVIAIGDQ